MPLGGQPSAIYLQHAPGSSKPNQPPKTPSNITVHPAALFSILDHYLRRGDAQDRVIGTLLGTRTNGGADVEVRTAFAVLHSETEEQVAVDMEYHRTMFELHQRANPKEFIVGWYSTGATLNTYSALIQNFYSQETVPHQAVHILLSTGAQQNEQVGVRAYVGSPVGVHPKPENCVFVPIPCELRFQDSERSGLSLLQNPSELSSSMNNLDVLDRSIREVLEMLDRVLLYVQSVLSGEREGNTAVGRYLLDTLGAGGTADDTSSALTGSLQDTLMVSYLANLVRSQVEVASRLALVA